MSALMRRLDELRQYPSALIGSLAILGLAILSVYTVIAIPYSEAVRLWRGGEEVWQDSPKNAWPVWYRWFVDARLPETVLVDGQSESLQTTTEALSDEITQTETRFSIDYPYNGFPSEIVLFLDSEYHNKRPSVSLTWRTPDGRQIRLGRMTPSRSDSYRFAQDAALQRRLGGQRAEVGLFADPSNQSVALEGVYELHMEVLTFEENSRIEPKLVVYGQVQGWAGTDHLRRDLMVALLWGTPVAMAFGLLAAVGTTVTTMAIAAMGVWFGGFLDAAIQRITEVNLILPLLPILIMIGTFYSRSIWVMLGVIILLSIFGASIKNYRAIFLQSRSLPYVEAAQAYGAGDLRIVFRYLVPRLLPMVVPQLVILVPGFVFLEASLAVLGLGDPRLPTWGKIIQDANAQGALFSGYYYWILEPAILLMVAGLAFAMVGFALDRVFNPRLREL